MVLHDKLPHLLSEASRKIEFYRDYFATHPELNSALLSSYPVVDKASYLVNQIAFVSSEHSVDTLKKKYTSGFTGDAMLIYKSAADELAQSRAMWARRREMGISPKMKCLLFHNYRDRHVVTEKKTRNMLIVNASLFGAHMTLEAMLEIQNVISEYCPEFIMSSPTNLCDYIYFCDKFGFRLPRISHVELMRESLFSFQKKLISRRFSVQVINLYVCTELLPLASEIEGSEWLYSFPQNVVFEILTEEGEITQKPNSVGAILVTGLNSYAMPFIRYKIGDVGMLLSTDFSNGLAVQILELRPGRVAEFVVYGGKSIHVSLICKMFDEIDILDIYCLKFKILYYASTQCINLYIALSDGTMFASVQKGIHEWVDENGYNEIFWEVRLCHYEELLQDCVKYHFFEVVSN